MKTKLFDIDNINEYLIKIRRSLHKKPEVQFDLKDTCRLVKQELKKIGLVPDDSYGKSSITALLEVKNPIKTIGLRADMDALSITEISNKEYKSLNEGVMHACGHDGHTAMLLGAAKILIENKEKLKCNVRFIFQASEEGPESGAKYMVDDGILDDVDIIFGMHLTNELDTGTAGASIGNAMASATRFSIDIIGKGGHAGTPQKAVDAIAVSARVITDIQYLVSREMNPFSPLVVNIGTINGGTISNAVAEKVTLTGTIRTFSKETTNYLKDRIDSIVKSAIEPCGGYYKAVFNEGLPPLINKNEHILDAIKSIKKVIGDNNFKILDEGKMGSEDFAYYLEKKPGCFIWLGSGNDEKGMRVEHHNPRFDFDEDALLNGVKIFVQYVLDQQKN